MQNCNISTFILNINFQCLYVKATHNVRFGSRAGIIETHNKLLTQRQTQRKTPTSVYIFIIYKQTYHTFLDYGRNPKTSGVFVMVDQFFRFWGKYIDKAKGHVVKTSSLR